MKKRKKKGYVDRSESFDDLLAKDNLLAETENAAMKKIVADQRKASMKRQKRGATPQS